MIYTVCKDSDNLSVIDLSSMQVIKTIEVGNFPYAVEMDSTTGNIFVANYYSDNVTTF